MTRSRIWKLAKLTEWQSCDSCIGFVMNKMDKTSHLLKQNWIVTYQKEVVCKERSSICCPQKSCMLPTSPCVSLLPIVLNSAGNLWIKSGETQKINISGRNCRKKVPTYHFIFGGSVTCKKSNIKNEVIIIAVFPVQSWLQQKSKVPRSCMVGKPTDINRKWRSVFVSQFSPERKTWLQWQMHPPTPAHTCF